MSGSRPFDQFAFIIATPDSTQTMPGLLIRSVAVYMAQLRDISTASLYVKRSGSTSIGKCYYTHTTELDDAGAIHHKATFQEAVGLGANDTVTWTTSAPHRITIEPAAKMDTPHGLYRAKCSCGEYESGASSQSHAQAAGFQHAAAKNTQEATTA